MLNKDERYLDLLQKNEQKKEKNFKKSQESWHKI